MARLIDKEEKRLDIARASIPFFAKKVLPKRVWMK